MKPALFFGQFCVFRHNFNDKQEKLLSHAKVCFNLEQSKVTKYHTTPVCFRYFVVHINRQSHIYTALLVIGSIEFFGNLFLINIGSDYHNIESNQFLFHQQQSNLKFVNKFTLRLVFVPKIVISEPIYLFLWAVVCACHLEQVTQKRLL